MPTDEPQVTITLTLSQIAGLQAAVSCLDCAVSGDLAMIAEHYADDELGLRRADLSAGVEALRVAEDQARPARAAHLAAVVRRVEIVSALIGEHGLDEGMRRALGR